MRTVARLLLCLLLTLGALRISASASAAEPAPKPYLDVWMAGDGAEDPAYHNQLAFWSTYRSDAGFRTALESAYQIRCFSIRKNIVFAVAHGITTAPVFARCGRPLIVGFRGADVLLGELGLKRPATAPQTATPPATTPSPPAPPAPAPISAEQIRGDLARALAVDLAELAAQLRAEQGNQAKAHQAETFANLQRLEQQLAQLAPMAGQMEQLRAELQMIARQWRGLREGREERGQGSEVRGQETAIAQPKSFWSRAITVAGTTLTIAQALGLISVSGGSLGVAGLAVWGAAKLWRRWQGTEGKDQGTEVRGQGAAPVESSSPVSAGKACATCAQLRSDKYDLANQLGDARQEIQSLQSQLTQSQAQITQLQQRATQPNSPLYAPYETDHFREAYEWAAREVVRKFPGAVDTLETLKEFMSQHLTSKGKARA